MSQQCLRQRVIGIFEAVKSGPDTVDLLKDGVTLEKMEFLRQQVYKGDKSDHLSLADFVSDDKPDHVGLFAVTAGVGLEEIVSEYENDHDDYSVIMVKALADRLAEAFAEKLHEIVRRDLWGYESGDKLELEALISEDYEGIRPAPGYPACPEHTEKEKLFSLIGARKCGIELTSSFAMYPQASVSGYYFAHPDSRYFHVGKVLSDKVEDYARRKGWSLEEAEKWLGPILAYENEKV